jgi:hypothetical protein
MSPANNLTAARVNEIFDACVLNDGQDTSSIAVVGIDPDLTFRFDRALIEMHAEEILAMLHKLPDQFVSSDGGRYSDASKDYRGYQWTGINRTVRQLVVLGLAIGKVEFCQPREEWAALPGGVPNFRVKR